MGYRYLSGEDDDSSRFSPPGVPRNQAVGATSICPSSKFERTYGGQEEIFANTLPPSRGLAVVRSGRGSTREEPSGPALS